MWGFCVGKISTSIGLWNGHFLHAWLEPLNVKSVGGIPTHNNVLWGLGWWRRVPSEGRGFQFGIAKGSLSLGLRRRRMLSGGRSLHLGDTKGRLSLSLGQGRRVLFFGHAQSGLCATWRFVGATKMSNQGSLRGSELIVSGVSVLVLGGMPGLAMIPRHDEN